MAMISLLNTKLDMRRLGKKLNGETHYSQDLPEYLSAMFPMFGTTGIGNNSTNKLYLPYATTGYLIRYIIEPMK